MQQAKAAHLVTHEFRLLTRPRDTGPEHANFLVQVAQMHHLEVLGDARALIGHQPGGTEVPGLDIQHVTVVAGEDAARRGILQEYPAPLGLIRS